MLLGNDNYRELLGIKKETPMRIAWDYGARGFHCPICLTGVSNQTKECGCCGQKLRPNC